MLVSLRRTLGHASIYGLSSVIGNLAGLVMLPIYTRYLSAADYGTVALVEMAGELIGLVLGMKVVAGLFRQYYAADTVHARNAVISTAMFALLLGKLAAVLVMLALAAPLASLLFADASYEDYVSLFAVTLVTNALAQVPFQYLRLLEMPWTFLWLSVARLVVQVTLNVVALAYLGLGVKGIIYSTIVSGLLVGGGMATWMLTRTGVHFCQRTARRLVSYGWPLVLSGLLAMYVNLGGRPILTRTHGLAEVGLFAVAFRLSSGTISLFWNSFMQAWGPERFRIFGQAGAVEVYQRVFTAMVIVLVAIGLATSLFAQEVLRVLAAPPFWLAADIVPWLACAMVLRAITQHVNFGLYVTDNTKKVLSINAVCALAVTIGYIVFIPSFGGQGAAALLVVAAGIELWLSHRLAKPFLDMALPWWKLWSAFGVAVVIYLVAATGPDDPLLMAAFKISLFVVFLAILILSPIVGSGERKQALAYATSTLQRMRRNSAPLSEAAGMRGRPKGPGE